MKMICQNCDTASVVDWCRVLRRQLWASVWRRFTITSVRQQDLLWYVNKSYRLFSRNIWKL